MSWSTMVLKKGVKAPDFEAEDQNGKLIQLSKLDKAVVYFYPKDDTPGCTREACGFRDQIDSFTEKGWTVIGVSTDTQSSHEAFAEKYDLNFSLIPDPEKAIAKAYKVKGKTGFAKRVTYLVENQEIIGVFEDVSPKEHALEVLLALENV